MKVKKIGIIVLATCLMFNMSTTAFAATKTRDVEVKQDTSTKDTEDSEKEDKKTKKDTDKNKEEDVKVTKKTEGKDTKVEIKDYEYTEPVGSTIWDNYPSWLTKLLGFCSTREEFMAQRDSNQTEESKSEDDEDSKSTKDVESDTEKEVEKEVEKEEPVEDTQTAENKQLESTFSQYVDTVIKGSAVNNLIGKASDAGITIVLHTKGLSDLGYDDLGYVYGNLLTTDGKEYDKKNGITKTDDEGLISKKNKTAYVVSYGEYTEEDIPLTYDVDKDCYYGSYAKDANTSVGNTKEYGNPAYVQTTSKFDTHVIRDAENNFLGLLIIQQ